MGRWVGTGMTEVTTDTTDRNDRPVAVGGIGNSNKTFIHVWQKPLPKFASVYASNGMKSV